MTNETPTPGIQARSGGLAELVQPPAPAPQRAGIGGGALIKLAVLTALVLAGHYGQLWLMVGRWRHDVNWSFSFLIPLFSIFLLYNRWGELVAAPRRGYWPGLAVLLAGICCEFAAFYLAHVPWLVQLSIALVVFGLVLFVAGPAVARITWLPIFYMIFAMPLPERLYQEIALPLQNFAAKSSGVLLHLCGVQIDVSSSHLAVTTISGRVSQLDVVEACSGIRSLIAFVALAVAMAYLTNRPIWQRVVLVTAAIPVAICCNVLRVTITCTMHVLDKPQWGSDFMHEFTGMLMLVPAFLMLWLLGKLMEWMVSEVDEEEESAAATAQSERK